MAQTAILGAGVMGRPCSPGWCARPAGDNLLVGEKRADRARELEERWRRGGRQRRAAARKADGPWRSSSSRKTWATSLSRDRRRAAGRSLVVSLAAGITTAFIESRVPKGVAVVRVAALPPALVDEGAQPPSRRARTARGSTSPVAESLMASVGRVLHPRAPAGCGHRDLRLGSGLHLLRGRSR